MVTVHTDAYCFIAVVLFYIFDRLFMKKELHEKFDNRYRQEYREMITPSYAGSEPNEERTALRLYYARHGLDKVCRHCFQRCTSLLPMCEANQVLSNKTSVLIFIV